jgi:eukaryotic-like serine/threonine-protein kinase
VSAPSWPQVKRVLEAVLAVAAEQREQALEQSCAGDAELRREVEEYLRYEASAQSLFPATRWRDSVPAAEQPPPERAGPWRILRELGRGGMGVVYLVERDDGEYRQTAALKLVRDERSGKTLDALFRHERQILAQLDHPNIARLLDGGTTSDGQPYYVMEYVEGQALSQWRKERDPSVEEILALFLKIAEAVSHAHRRLIIHRDLKPGNVLITPEGQPKLLDFGVARMLDASPRREVTITGWPLLTPVYASPEQVRGEPLTTATDVYSLGVILYEMLAGRLPFGAERQTLFQTWMAVCEATPAAPSAVAPSLHAARLGDLDAIVLMAMRKEPEARYLSVEALHADIVAYLAGRPVIARQSSALYRLRRFVARRKWAVAASVAAVVLAAGSFAAVWSAQRRAEMRFQQLRRFARSVVFELHDSIETLPGSTAARKLLVERSLEYLRTLENSSSNDPSLQWEIAEAYKRIGDAQGNTSQANLGDSAGALESYGHARKLIQRLLERDPGNSQAITTLVGTDRTAADILENRGRRAEAQGMRREAIELLGRMAERNPTLQSRKTLALAQWSLASNLLQSQDWDAAAKAFEQTLALYEALGKEQPGDPNAQRNIALSHKRLAAIQLQRQRLADALPHFAAAERIDRARLAAAPLNAESRMDLSFDLSDKGLALTSADRDPEALAAYREALALRRAVVASDLNDYRARASLGRSLDLIARQYGKMNEHREAIAAAREAVATLSQVFAHDRENQYALRELALASQRLGEMLRQAARRSGAGADWRAAAEAYQHASERFASLAPAFALTKEDRDRIGAIGPALEECRRGLAGHKSPRKN